MRGVLLAGAVGLGLVLFWPRKREVKKEMPSITTKPTDKVAALAAQEHALWAGRPESSDFGRERIRTYWEKGVGVPEAYPPEVPWSGAFIAWVTRTADPGALAASGRHTVYAKAAINARRVGQYKAYPAYVVRVPEPGDIVLKPRPGQELAFGELHDDESFDSHADIIVEVNDHHVVAVGGNKKGDTVRTEVYPRTPTGSVGGNVFAVLKRGPAPIYFLNDPDWRRATQSEVTDEMRKDAATAVKVLALGERLYGNGYMIGVETHYDNDRLYHRGASVFLPADDHEAGV